MSKRWFNHLATKILRAGLLGLILLGCAKNESLEGGAQILQPVAGMTMIKSNGKTFHQGAAGAGSSPNENPAILNSFNYDFLMDTVEVTQKYFQHMMNRDTLPVAVFSGKGDAYPIYNVSWFDAVLFCNARSKAAGLDTVYTYSKVEQASGGSVFDLPGLSIHLEKFGYRLPTEAEWEFAAKAGLDSDFPWGALRDSSKAPEYAWFARNAKGSTHPVANLKPNSFGLYDMAGNVMEWVNDWKSSYPSVGTEDFAGARDPGIEFDIPVKGGAFKYGLTELRVANRSATYTTIRSATAEYVGFRCVLGTIAVPHFSTPDGNWANTDAFQLDIVRIKNLVGGRAAKLVFVNATQSVRHLAYVDYQKSPPRVHEFGDIANVFYPVISPDGNWVAFGTASEGASTGSTIYIRSLGDTTYPSRMVCPGFIPRWWVDPASQDTFLIYVNSATDNSQAKWSSTQTFMQKIKGGEPVGLPSKLTDAGFHDGRSSNGRWLATGYRLLKLKDLISGAVHTLFTAPENGKEAKDTSQVCNVSIAPDSSGHTLFLDFGYAGKSKLTGSFYDIHQIAFLADETGKVLKWFEAPSGEKGWEDLEWTNGRDFAISSATDNANGHHHIYLLNLKDSTVTLLASGTRLSMPGMWLGGRPDMTLTTGLALDSLGHYDDPATDIYQAVFSNRMALFWKRHQSLEMIFTGSSHVFSGIDPSRITRFKSINLGYPANGWLGQEIWTTGYALNHCPKLKILVMEVFPGWMHFPGGDFTWLQQISKTKGVAYDASNKYWNQGLPMNFEDLVAQAPNSSSFAGDSMGFYPWPSEGWGGMPSIPTESEWTLDDSEYVANVKRIEDFARMIANRNIHLVFLNLPTSPAYKDHEYYGPYGPRTKVAVGIIQRFQAMEKISPYIHFYDAQNFSNHDYTEADALNSGHLSAQGAAKLTSRLDSLVNTFP